MPNAQPSQAKSDLQMTRCRKCRQPLPTRVMLAPGSVVTIYCRHCKVDTVVVARERPHWG